MVKMKNKKYLTFLSLILLSCSIPLTNTPTEKLKKDILSFKTKSVNTAIFSGLAPEGDSITVTLSGTSKIYKFYANAGQYYKISLSQLDGKNAHLRLFKPSNTTSTSDIENDDFGTTTDSKILFKATESGYHKIIVSTHEEVTNGTSPVGAFELGINDYFGKSHPSSAMDKNGNTIVVWQEFGTDGSGWGIYGRKIDKSGNNVGDVFKINNTTEGDQKHPSVAINKDTGFFIVTWEGVGSGDNSGIFIKRFNADTTAYDSYPNEYRVNYKTDGFQSNPAIVVGTDNSCAITWQTLGSVNNDGIWLFRLGNFGTGEEKRVNTSTGGYRINPKIALNQGSTNYGKIFVVWQGEGSGDTEGIFEREFSLINPNESKPEYRLNSNTEGIQSNIDVAMASDGKSVFTWQTNGSVSNNGIFIKYTNENSIAGIGDILLSDTNNDYSFPRVSINQSDGKHNGEFYVAWQGVSSGDETAILQRRGSIKTQSFLNPMYRANFNSEGIHSTPIFSNNATTTNDENLDSLSLNYSQFIEIWNVRGSNNKTDGIYANFSRNSNIPFGLDKIISNPSLISNMNPGIKDPISDSVFSGIAPEGDPITVTLSGTSKLYKFYANVGQYYKISLSQLDGKNAHLRLFKPSNTTSTSDIENDDFGTTTDSKILFKATESGYHKIIVSTHEEVTNGTSPVGAFELGINDYFGKSHPSSAMDKNGNTIVVWQEFGTDGSGWGIYGRKIDKSGNNVGDVFKINNTTEGDQKHPSVAINKDTGFFIVTWEGVGSGDNSGIFIKRFNADTTAYDSYPNEYRVNYKTDGFQSNPAIVVGTDNSCAITWQTLGSVNNDGIWLFRLGNFGTGEEKRVNTSTGGYRINPKIALNQGSTNYGKIFVVWQGEGSGDTEGIFEREFSLINPNESKPEYRLNSNTEGIQSNIDVAMASDGKSVFTWQTNGSVSNNGIFIKYTNENSIAGIGDILLSDTNNDYSFPRVSINQSDGKHNGEFYVAWQGVSSGDETAILQRRGSIKTQSFLNPMYRANFNSEGIHSTPVFSNNATTINDENLDSFDFNYSQFIEVWNVRGSNNKTDGIYANFSRNNNITFGIDKIISNPSSISNINPELDPIIQLSDDSIDFGNITTSSSKNITITNSGGGILNWTAVSEKEWMDITPKSGIGDGSINITVNPTLLSFGTYNASVKISLGNETRDLLVSFTKEEIKNDIDVSKTLIDLGKINQISNSNFNIIKKGSIPVSWNIISEQPWLTVDKLSGNDSSIINIIADPTLLEKGLHNATLTINSSLGQLYVTVTFEKK